MTRANSFIKYAFVVKPIGKCSGPHCQEMGRVAVKRVALGRTNYRKYCLQHIPKTVGTPGPGPVVSLDGVECYTLRSIWQALTLSELRAFEDWVRKNEYGGMLPNDSLVVYKYDWDRWWEEKMKGKEA